ncbi:PR5-like receptor kinase isoform X1 [Silene latifolia]|uniref:PR5-like receptor kinase isoform X1 n=2 Tax=Silene latifolia TaxID=37657 RepID=UPI003D782BBA
MNAACSVFGLGMLALLACYIKRRYSKKNQDIDGFLKKHGPLPTNRYTYRSLKKITNSFKDKLGEGGYGIVYKGKLPNGNLVAVKLLKESKGNAEEFINEVTSIGWSNHVNVVTLLGFCFEGQRRALLYDFMPNGSLEKFIYAKNSHRSLNSDELFKIAVGIARGLEYLHRGCNTRIVHFDIKPHNILLDENFCPKISDFGLAKRLQGNNSIISMSGARGSVGFIAPEVYLNGFGSVSHKSDVYSYGMLVLDMVGCRNNANAQVGHSSEQYFPQWIYKQLEKTDECGHQDRLDGEERVTQRKMILVSLWCIQTNPSRRPPMSKVVEMLEGPLESLQIPDTPSLFTPPISQPISSSNVMVTV